MNTQEKRDKLAKELRDKFGPPEPPKEGDFDDWKNLANFILTREEGLQADIAAIETGIRNEFYLGEPSGDVLQDFAMLIDHHKKVELIVEAAKSLVNRMEEVYETEEYRGVWICAMNHGLDYTNGPKWEVAFNALKASIEAGRMK